MGSRSRASTGDPIKDLCVALIKRAVEDCKVKRRLMMQKQRWIHITTDDPEYFLFEERSDRFLSFDFICTEVFKCEPGKVREMIRLHLSESAIRVGLSSRQIIRRKLWQEKEIMRTPLMRWAWSKYRIDKEALDYCIIWLMERQEVTMRIIHTYNKGARFYYWIGADRFLAEEEI